MDRIAVACLLEWQAFGQALRRIGRMIDQSAAVAIARLVHRITRH